MAWVYKRGRIWWIKYRGPDGRQKRANSGSQSKTVARQLGEELEVKARRVSLGLDEGARPRITGAELWRVYARTVVARKASRASDDGRWRLHAAPVLGAKQCSEVTPAMVEQLLTDLEGKGLAPATRERVRALIRGMWNFGIHRLGKVRGPNPAAGAALKVRVPKRKPRFLALAQLAKVLSSVPGHLAGVFAVAIYLGLRKGEILGLLRRDVDLQARRIRVSRSYANATTKDGEEKILPIPVALVPYLRAALRVPTSLFLFPGPGGRMQSKHLKLEKITKRALVATGLIDGYDHKCRRRDCGFAERRPGKAPALCPDCGFKLWAIPVPLEGITFKSLRSSFATHVTRGDGIRAAQALLGHSDIKLTADHYAGVDDRDLRRAVNRLKLPKRA